MDKAQNELRRRNRRAPCNFDASGLRLVANLAFSEGRGACTERPQLLVPGRRALANCDLSRRVDGSPGMACRPPGVSGSVNCRAVWHAMPFGRLAAVTARSNNIAFAPRAQRLQSGVWPCDAPRFEPVCARGPSASDLRHPAGRGAVIITFVFNLHLAAI